MTRVIISALVIIVVLFSSQMFFSVLYPTVTRSTGLEQMKDSNEGIIITQTADVLQRWFVIIPGIIIVAALLLIWWKPLKYLKGIAIS